jgi:hypothetical protein
LVLAQRLQQQRQRGCWEVACMEATTTCSLGSQGSQRQQRQGSTLRWCLALLQLQRRL